MRPAKCDGFEIAIICALTREADAVEALFDETYDKFSHVYRKQARDTNTYTTGRIGQHNVVLCYLPGMGKGSAAAAAANLRVSYTGVQLALVVGICGGVPFPSSNTEIILGDVIISDSVIEYDFGRQYPDGFQQKSDAKDTLGRPNQEVRAFLAGLKGRKTLSELQVRIYQHLHNLQSQPDTLWEYPGITYDVLFEVSYRHRHYQRDPPDRCICASCNCSDDPVCEEALNGDCNDLGCAGNHVPRRRHSTKATNPSVYIGTIASADRVMKSGEHRNKIAKAEGVIGFEMEGSGVWDNMPCIIIKGVCDYADSHKNKKWQDYAAATAASGAKAFLHYWPSTSSETSITQTKCANIAHSLRDYYTSGKRLEIQRISGELLPMDQCYINLAIVEQSRSTKAENANQRSPFSLFSRLKVEIIDENRQISLSSLFEPRKQPDGTNIVPKRVFIEGRAGVGKTTLCKQIVDDYLHHDMWCQLFDLVLWVPLRRLKSVSDDKCTLSSLFYQLYFSGLDEGRELARSLQEMVSDPTGKNKILFLLDGLDEVSQEWEPETKMNDLLLRLLDHPRVIITSRPYGMNRSSLGSFDLELETVGFNATQVEAYVAKTNAEKANSILTFIQEHAIIKGLVQIPIQLDALCYTWDRSFMTGDEPKTMTSLYQEIVLKLWRKDILRLGKHKGGKDLNEYTVQSLTALEIQGRILPSEVSFLQIFAFIGIYNEVIEFNANDRHRIQNCLEMQGVPLPAIPERLLKSISFLHSSDITVMDQDRSYHFLHLTFQEFFAAQYFVNCWINNKQMFCMNLRERLSRPCFITPHEFLRREKYNSRYDIMWRFVAGLLQGVPGQEQESEKFLKNFIQELEAEPRDMLGPVHQRLLMHCLSEVVPGAQSELNRLEMEEHMSDWLQFECDFHSKSLLGREREFPVHILQSLLQIGSEKVKKCILEALSERQTLPAALEGLISLLKDDYQHSHQSVERIVRNDSRFYSILPNLDARYWRAIYPIWLTRSFHEQVSCYQREGCVYLDAPERLWEIPFKNQSLAMFKGEIQTAQLTLRIPSCSPSVTSRRKLVKSKRKLVLFGWF